MVSSKTLLAAKAINNVKPSFCPSGKKCFSRDFFVAYKFISIEFHNLTCQSFDVVIDVGASGVVSTGFDFGLVKLDCCVCTNTPPCCCA